MLIPSIDLRQGRAVQLRGGRELVLDAGDPAPWLTRFSRIGDVAVVDLDAALGTGEHRNQIAAMCAQARCRVGGGIRDLATARFYLDTGATQIVLGTRAEPELLRQLPVARVIAALDARDGEVVVDGWRTATGRSVFDRIAELRPFVAGFLVTVVEREGRMTGIDLELAKALRAAAGDRSLTLAGGIRSPEDVRELDRLGVDAQVGMALYTGAFDEADALAALLIGEPPWPTVIVDDLGVALGLCWSDPASLRAALQQGRGIYHSRRRGLWVKGATSGATQELLGVDLDCDRDALRFRVRQHGAGFCHQATATCWGATAGLPALTARIAAAATGTDPASYTRRLLADPDLLRAKLIEEAAELAAANDPEAVAAEAADLLYFTAVAMQRAGVRLAEVAAVLDRRATTVTRRPGNAKPRAVQP